MKEQCDAQCRDSSRKMSLSCLSNFNSAPPNPHPQALDLHAAVHSIEVEVECEAVEEISSKEAGLTNKALGCA